MNDGLREANPSASRLSGAWGRWLALAWGAAEASFFFLVPDMLLTWVALKAPRKVWLHLLLAVLGAAVVGSAMFAWAARDGSGAQGFVQAVPRVVPAMFDQAQKDLQQEGAAGLMRGPARGIPYKVYAVLAPAQGVTLGNFAAMSVPARAWRMVLMVVGFAAVGWVMRRLGLTRWVVPLFATFWVVSMAYYWIKIG
jgi:hypothetical protein